MAGRAHLIADNPAPETVALLGGVLPGRWGRMPLLSRAMIVEVGLTLQHHGLLHNGLRLCDGGLMAGLVGATRHGSLHTDLAFKKSMEMRPGLASPALFGYTLPNTPLAEAAVIFGLMGPVYAVFHDGDNLQQHAAAEAEALMEAMPGLDCMLACGFDQLPGDDTPDALSVTLTVATR